jgi:O-antigen ligase
MFDLSLPKVAGNGRRSRVVAFLERRAGPWVAALLFVYFLFGFVGANPLAGGVQDFAAVSQGSILRQSVLLAIFAASFPFLVVHRLEVIRLWRSAVPLLLMLGWLAVSAAWSVHPDLTIRRIVGELLVFCTLAAAVTAVQSLRVLVWPVVAAAATAIVLDLSAVLAFPNLALGPLGALGIHDNKNTAGIIALAAVILVGGTSLTIHSLRIRWGMLSFLAAVSVFLILTDSKTSIAIAVLTAVCYPPFHLAMRRWSVAPVVVPVTFMSFIALGALAAAFLGVPVNALSEFFFGDATLTQRTELWFYLHGNIAAHPLLGSGWGAFWDTGAEVNPINAPPGSWVLKPEINTAHNGYLDIWLQAGLVGLALELVVLLRFFWVYGGLLRRSDLSTTTQRLFGTLFAVAIALVVYNGDESILFQPSHTLSSLFILAALAGERWRQWPRMTSAVCQQSSGKNGGSMNRRRFNRLRK